MYKRRDWLDVHGQDGGDTTSDSEASASASEDESDDGQADGPEASASEQEASDDSGASSSGTSSGAGDGPAAAQKQHTPLHGRAASRKPMPAVPAQEDSDSDLESQDDDDVEEKSGVISEQHRPSTAARRSREREGSHAERRPRGVKRPLDVGSDDSGDASGRDQEDSNGKDNQDGEDADAGEGSSGREYEDLHVEEVIKNWAEESPDNTVRGVALKCMACKSLLLNALAYRDHLKSKRHTKALKSWTEGEDDLIVFATDTRKEEEAETHTERLQRLQQQAAGTSSKGGSSKGKHKKHKQAGSKGRQPRIRPGKRQRAALKEQKAAGAKQHSS